MTIKKFTKENIIQNDLSIYIIFFSILIIGQPILQGVEVSGKNIIRLSTLAFIQLLIFFEINSKSKKLLNYKFLFLLVILFILNSHSNIFCI